ncbi:MAG: serine/threonine-protein kinase [Trebonia sp.]
MSTPTADAPGPVASESGRTWSVPGYTELRVLGGGGFGEVVLATHHASGNQVAIKYLRPDLLADPELAALFRAEAATLGQLDSPHVVRLYEYVEGPAGAAIVMELVDGVSLAKILESQGKATALGALVILYGSLLGLAAAHERGVVHRDYKPANVLVNGAGASKLTDFGIAALAGDRPMPAGTARYMPPEQFEGAVATPAADVYAATVTFYQCLTGRPPFSGQTTADLYEQHRSASVPMELIPPPLRPIVARGMAKDPADRSSNAAELAADLRTAASGSYGADWEDRGRSHLAEAALLLALLWPSGGTSAVAGTTVEQLNADPSRAAHHPQSPSGSQAQPVSEVTRHGWHEEHVRHEEHLEHVRHEEHLQHAAHGEHLEHLAHVRAEDGGRAGQPSRRASRPRPRLHLAVAGGATVVVVAAVAGVAVALSSHNGSGSSGGSTSAVAHAATGGPASSTHGGAGGGTVTVPTFTASFSMTRHIISCNPAGDCITGPLPLTIVCHSNGSCTATSSHWGSSKKGTINGSTLSFSGIDTAVSGCDQPNQVTLNLTVTSWSAGNAATRKPLALSGPYTVLGPATSGCTAWDLHATLTSS